MEKKKVAILLPWLKMGGTNKIALNFINIVAYIPFFVKKSIYGTEVILC